MRLLRSSLRAALTAGLLGLAACHAEGAPAREGAAELPELGLMGTIPIYWGESGDFGELLAGNGADHWARPRLEADYRLRPLDALDGESLEDLDFLILAQPRALSAPENVALDAWVRRGGRLLLFADPMLTGESRFAIGDRRRPQDVILLSPILRHWGLDLAFDDQAPARPALVAAARTQIPVNLPGSFTLREENSGCELMGDGVLASCAIGRGRAVVLADAALLDLNDAHPAAARALDALVAQAFASNGDGAGSS